MIDKIILLTLIGTIIIRLKRIMEIEAEDIEWSLEYITESDNYNSDIEDYLNYEA